MASGDLSQFKLKDLTDFLKSDIYIVFGTSYIKGELIDFLVEKAINIHMGVSLITEEQIVTFWALFDNNPHLAGSTIHLLSKGLDSGPIFISCDVKFKK